MAANGDLQIKVTADASEVATAMAETRSQLDQTITTIQVQDQSWRNMSASMIGSAASIAGPVISLITAQKRLAAATLAASTATTAATVPTITLAGAMALLASPAVIVSAAIVAVGAGLYYFAGGSDEATESLGKQKEKLEEVGASYKVWMATAGKFESGLISDETSLNLEKIKTESDKVSESLGKTVTIISEPFSDGAYAVGVYAASLLGIESASEFALKGTRLLGQGVEWLNTKATSTIDTLKKMALVYLGGQSEESAKAFVAEGHAIKDLAKETDARIARMESEKQARNQFNDIIKESEATAARAADAERIRSTYTIEGIEKEIEILKRKAIAEVAAEEAAMSALLKKKASKKEIEEQEKKDDEAARNRADLAGKAVTQKRGIETGEIVSPVQAAINSSRMELIKLTEGEDAAAIAALRLKAATDEQKAAIEASIPAFLAAREAVRDANKAKDEQKAIADLLKKAADDEAATQQRAATQIAGLTNKIELLNGSATQAEISLRELASQGFTTEQAETISGLNSEVEKLAQQKTAADKVTSLKDQIDLLSGAATEADIAMRELGRAGFTDDQISEIGALTEQLDTLKESQKKQPKEKAEKDDAPKVALQGSKEAAEIMLRGVGGGNKMEQIGQQQLAEQRKMVAALSKPAAVNPAMPQRPAEPQRLLPLTQPVAPLIQKPPAPVFTPNIMLPELAAPEPVTEKPMQSLPIESFNAKPIPNLTPLVPRSVIPPTPTIQAIAPITDMGGGDFASPIAEPPAVEPRVTIPSVREFAQQPAPIPVEPSSSGTTELVARPVVSPIEVASPEMIVPPTPDVAIPSPKIIPPNVPALTLEQPKPISSPMDSAWEQHALAVQQSLVSDLASGPQLSAADNNVPIDQAAFPEVSFKPNVKPIEMSAPDVAAIDIPSPVVNAPAQSQIAIPSPIVNTPKMAPLSVAAPEIQAEQPSPVLIPQPVVSAPKQASVAIPAPLVNAPTMSPIAMESPTVITPETPSIAIPAPNVAVPQAGRVNIPEPIVSTPEPSRIAIPEPFIATPATPAVSLAAPRIQMPERSRIDIPSPSVTTPTVEPISVPTPAVSVAAMSPINVAQPSVNVPSPPAITIPSPKVQTAAAEIQQPRELAPPTVSIAPLAPITLPAPTIDIAKANGTENAQPSAATVAQPIAASSPMDIAPLVTSASQQLAATQSMTATISRLTLAAPDVTTNVAAPQAANTFAPTVNVPELPTPRIQSPSVNVDVAASPSPKIAMPELKMPKAPKEDLDRSAGLSKRSERGSQSEGVVDTKSLEKYAERQLLALGKIEIATRANKPQQLAAGSV